MMEEGDTDPSPIRGTAHMFRCPVCDAKGKTGMTLGWGGTLCSLCQGRCYLTKEPTACPCCDAKGGFPSLFGLKWNTCRLCHGVRYLKERPFPCPKCRATGMVKWMGGVFSAPCDLCDRQRYLKHPHGRCIKCNYTSTFGKYLRGKCINCSGIGYSPEPQHLCPRCNSTGRVRGNACMLCEGNGVLHHEVVACANCSGAGEIKRTLSLLLGNATCPTCNGRGYFDSLSSGQAVLGAQRPIRKRGRKSEGDQRAPSLSEGDGESDDGWRMGGGGGGGSEPRRRAKKTRITPLKDGSRRQTISTFDPGSEQFPPGPRPSPSAAGAAATVSGVPGRPRGGIDIVRPSAGDGFDGGVAGIFSPGVGRVENDNGKRRRGH